MSQRLNRQERRDFLYDTIVNHPSVPVTKFFRAADLRERLWKSTGRTVTTDTILTDLYALFLAGRITRKKQPGFTSQWLWYAK